MAKGGIVESFSFMTFSMGMMFTMAQHTIQATLKHPGATSGFNTQVNGIEDHHFETFYKEYYNPAEYSRDPF